MLLEHASRWGSLVLDVEGQTSLMDTRVGDILGRVGDMTRLRRLEIENLGKGAEPWFTVLEIMTRSIPQSVAASVNVTELGLLSHKEHRDSLVETGVDLSPFLCPNLTLIRAHVVPRVAVKIQNVCPSLVNAEFEFTVPLRKSIKGWSLGPVLHHRLSHLSMRTSPCPAVQPRRSFPHDVFSAILDHVVCPSLSSITIQTAASCPVRPMGVDGPADETEYMKNLEATSPSNDNDDGNPEHVATSLNPFFPSSLIDFVSTCPSLQMLDLDGFSLPSSSHLIRLLEITPTLTDLRVWEVVEEKSARESDTSDPSGLACDDWLCWLENKNHLPLLRHLKLNMVQKPRAAGSLERLLGILVDSGRLKSAVINYR
ncbi:hypothetical protein AAF712_015244, partial [Marasmius tenuissimus]